jgi:hypothetical protein
MDVHFYCTVCAGGRRGVFLLVAYSKDSKKEWFFFTFSIHSQLPPDVYLKKKEVY